MLCAQRTGKALQEHYMRTGNLVKVILVLPELLLLDVQSDVLSLRNHLDYMPLLHGTDATTIVASDWKNSFQAMFMGQHSCCLLYTSPSPRD